MPLPVDEALTNARAVAGVIHPRPRIWGVVSTPTGPITIIGLLPDGRSALADQQPLPGDGEALAGPGVVDPDRDGRLVLQGAISRTVRIIGRLPDNTALATNDLVLLNAADARLLLGLTRNQASDLALDVFHEEETEALCAELAQAFAWPVQIVTRREAMARVLADIDRRTSFGLLVLIPAGLALVLMVLAVYFRGRHRQWEVGLFKAVGWTSADILRLQACRSLLIWLPATTAGIAVAYGLIFGPGLTWIPRMLFDWSGSAPGMNLAGQLTGQGVAGNFILSAMVVGLPFFGAGFWSAWQGVTADPGDLLEGVA
jgi:hypothetical protein